MQYRAIKPPRSASHDCLTTDYAKRRRAASTPWPFVTKQNAARHLLARYPP